MVSKVTPDTMMSASRLTAVMGLSKYRTPNDELECSINAMQFIEREDIGNEAMAWGNLMEPLILTQAAERLRLSDLVIDHPSARYHAELPLCCSLDGTGDGGGQVIHHDPDSGIYVVGADTIKLDGVGVLEAKLTAMDVEEMPPLWRGPIQLQAQMDIVHAKWGCVATLYRGTALRIFLFEPHQETIDYIARVSREFQDKLDKWKETGEIDYYPPADGERWPEHRGPYPSRPDPIELDDEAEMLAEKIVFAKQAIKSLEKIVTDDEKTMQTLMNTAEYARAGKYDIKWPIKQYDAQPAKTVPAKKAYTIRQATLAIKEVKKK
jgi:predicted phage-related endonuclease